MKYLKDLSNLISVRNFLALSIDNLHIKLSKEDIKNIQARIQLLDKTIIEKSLKLDLSELTFEPGDVVRSIYAESSEDTETVMNRFAGASGCAYGPPTGPSDPVSRSPDISKVDKLR